MQPLYVQVLLAALRPIWLEGDKMF